jgi:shikimate dehydrogenase
VVCRDGQLIGENTDGKGFVESLSELTDPKGKKIVIFGAGGAARAISVEMALAGATAATIVNRSVERGEGLVALLKERTDIEASFAKWDGPFSIPDGTDVVINATSIGLFPDINARLDINFDTLTSSMMVADVIPNPPETHLVKTARDLGCPTIDGLGMLVNQGVIGIKYWTGVDPDPKVMRAALEDVFSGQE